MNPLRLLIVEDDPQLLGSLKKLYRELLGEHGFAAVAIEQAATVEEARELARAATTHPYDLVSLDVNLGDREQTGLDVLGTLNRFQSAWMVALLTGVETDLSVDETMGKTTGESLRKRLRHEACKRFPAERLQVVEKPSASLPVEEIERLLSNRVRQIALIYGEVSKMRYIFRPIRMKGLARLSSEKGAKKADKGKKRPTVQTSSVLWQIRYNCGDLLTVPDKTGFLTLHHLLAMPRSETLTPEQAMALEPKNDAKEKVHKVGIRSDDHDPVAEYFEAHGIAWSALSGAEQEKMIAIALSQRFHRYTELREFQEEDDLSADEEDELNLLIDEFGPLAEAAEMGFLRTTGREDDDDDVPNPEKAAAQEGLHAEGGNYEKSPGQKGYDSPAAANFRARKSRALKSLRENGFVELADHLEAYIQSTGANWSYNPPGDLEWMT